MMLSTINAKRKEGHYVGVWFEGKRKPRHIVIALFGTMQRGGESRATSHRNLTARDDIMQPPPAKPVSPGRFIAYPNMIDGLYGATLSDIST
jgi:hypothetical protein